MEAERRRQQEEDEALEKKKRLEEAEALEKKKRLQEKKAPKKEETVSEAEPGEPEELRPGKQVPRWKNRNGSEKEKMRRKWVESHAEQQGLDAELCKLGALGQSRIKRLLSRQQDRQTMLQVVESAERAAAQAASAAYAATWSQQQTWAQHNWDQPQWAWHTNQWGHQTGLYGPQLFCWNCHCSCLFVYGYMFI